MVNSSWMSQATCVAAELGIADLLGGGPKNPDELAAATGCHAPSLGRLMRALASLELCQEDEQGSFRLTPLGSLLRTDAPHSVRSWAIWWGKYLWPVWAHLRYSVTTGKSARPLVTGDQGFDHLQRDAGMAGVFHRAMAELTRLEARELVAAYDFSACNRVVDVGGGYGELLAAILKAHPRMRGILFDLPQAAHGATRHLEELRVAHRFEFVAGDFFESVPSGADIYVLKNILHDWDDEHVAIILRNCRRAMSEDARLLVVERMMDLRMESSRRHQGMARSDLNMLVALGGRERTKDEFGTLLDGQGFRIARIVPIGLDFSIIDAAPAADSRRGSTEPGAAVAVRKETRP
jgi:SAM-dependent methyltransferase